MFTAGHTVDKHLSHTGAEEWLRHPPSPAWASTLARWQNGPVRRTPEPAILVILASLGMIGPFAIDTVFPSFNLMAADLGVDPISLQQLVSVYLLGFAVMSPFHGPVSDAAGRRVVVITGLLVFAVASAGAALSPTLGALLTFRALQGMSAGAGQIVSRAMVRDLYTGEMAQKMMAAISMIFGLAPAIAPIIGGLILGFTHWRGIFWFLAAYGLLMVIASALWLPESHPPEARTPLDLRSLTHGLWVVASKPAGIQLSLISTFNFAGMFLYISAAPMFVFNLMGLGEHDFWVLFVPLISGMVAGSWLNGRLAHLPQRKVAGAGFVIGVVGASLNLVLSLSPATQGIPWSVLPLPIFTFGVALAFPILVLAMLDEFPDRRGAAASVQSFVQLLANAAIAAWLAPLLGGELWHLAAGAMVIHLIGWALWKRYLTTHPLTSGTLDPR